MATSGILLVDKPAGWTSHDVVARVRKLAGTRRVGHAGTLDPMATGVLVIGIERATRLLGHLTLTEKAYDATIRLGQRTVTDDAEGEVTEEHDVAGLSGDAVASAIADTLTGDIEQVPPQFSAVKIAGERSYKRARRGEDTELAARAVRIHTFRVDAVRVVGQFLDVDATVVCSSGTYIRALARDLGGQLGVGGHLTALRRTRVGCFSIEQTRTLEQLAGPSGSLDSVDVLGLADAVATLFTRREVSEAEARRVAHGGWLPVTGCGSGPVGVFGPDGSLLALMEDREGAARPLAVFAS